MTGQIASRFSRGKVRVSWFTKIQFAPELDLRVVGHSPPTAIGATDTDGDRRDRGSAP